MKAILTFAVLTGLSITALAGVTVQDPWVLASVAQQTTTGAFMVLISDQPLKLVGIQTPVAKSVEIHEMNMDGDTMRMREIKSLDLAAGTPVAFKPGSYHLMLLGLTQPLKTGTVVPLTLIVEDAGHRRGTIDVKAIARPLTEAAGTADHMH